ncbi:EpsG family protein [Pantoea alhagi]|uniref:EpsG family protein n=1 Tax=Pantoea alhagi TaxID=1891675 RepID=UPI00202B4D73|nr:EpsG family protein [Pantoea alhagi]URQ59612.1 EpsG family protein [Pantoea alhagi]
MILYIAVYILFIFIFFAGTIPAVRNYEKIILLFACFVTWFIVAFSQFVGPDYESYKFMYDRLNVNFYKQEPLFRLSGYVFRVFDLPYSWFYFSMVSVYLFFISVSFFKYRNFIALNFLIFIVMPYGLIEGGFNYIRQNVALGIFYFSLIALNNRSAGRYFLLNIIGALFHKSALILLPLYYFLGKKWKSKTCIIIFLISLGITLLLAIPIIKKGLILLMAAMPYYGSTYVAFKDGAFIQGLSMKGVASYVYQMIPLVLLTYYKERIIFNKIENILFNITFLSLITLTFAVELRIFLRLEYYFVFAKVFTIPLLLRLCRNKKSRTLWFLIIFLWVTLYLIALYITGVEKNLIPYQSVLGFEVS